MTEPGIATQSDFITAHEEINMRELTHTLRYHAAGIGSVVASGAFDRLRDAYLKATENIYLGNCTICGGEVTTQQQFLRVERDFSEFPDLSHILCEYRRTPVGTISYYMGAKIRYQAREIESQHNRIFELETTLANIRLALGNFGQTVTTKGRRGTDAVSQGEKQSRNISEHPYRGDSGQTAEASSSDSAVKGGEVPSEEQPAVETSQGPVMNGPYNFRTDDVASGDDLIANGTTNYKWPPEFRRFIDRSEPVLHIAHPNCHLDPLGCPDEETNEQKYALYGPQHSIATNANCIGSSCE